MARLIISLQNVRFFAHHGVFEEERILGNEFAVNLSLTVKAPKEMLTELEQTINYAEVYRIVNERFSSPTPLLETLAMQIAGALKQAFPSLKKVGIQIAKLHPPIAAFTGSVSVTYQKRYKGSQSG